MQSGALAPYERALRTGGPLGLVDALGRHHRLDVDRWVGEVDIADESVLSRCHGPVLDVGCGPGRLVAALARRGTAALGIDIAAEAVRAARRRGGTALQQDLFTTAPASHAAGWDPTARWATVLLVDGNIGIGGDPQALLSRVADLLGPGGQVIVEADGSPAAAAAVNGEQVLDAQFVDHVGRHAPVFSWAILGPAAVTRQAAGAGLRVSDRWTAHGRVFLCLVRT